MPTKRFLSTAAPIAILALAGMGLATAQSSSPFAPKKRAQAWEQTPKAWEQPAAPQSSAPQSWGVPAAQTAAPQTAPPQSPGTYQAPAQYNSAPAYTPPSKLAPIPASVPASEDAPIATQRHVSSKMKAFSTKTPPKTFGGRAAPQFGNYPSNYVAGSPAPQAPVKAAPKTAAPQGGAAYNYTPPSVRVAQASDYGSSVPPTGQPQSAPSEGSPYAPRSGNRPQAWETQSAPPQPQVPTYQNPQNQGQAYPNQNYSGQSYGAPSSTPPTGAAPNGYNPNGYSSPNGYAPNGYNPGGSASPTPPSGASYPGGPFSQGPQQKRSWTEKLGLKRIATLFRGKVTVGAAATDRDLDDTQIGPSDGWSSDQIADAELEFEASAITDGGLEYGVALGARAQYDPFRRGFGGQLPECTPGLVGCSGTISGLRGHTSGFYSGGEDITQDGQIALESAHLFLRSAYGDVTLGRDDGAAYLFSLGAPTLLAVGASNSPVDYTGLDSVKTVNDASGFAEKITYTSPRLLGDQIGFGVQLGVSYALDGDVCGVDYCNGKNIDGILQPEIDDIVEAGIAIDRTFGNGLRAELTGTYARGSEQTDNAEFDDLESYGAGIEFEYNKWTLGGSFLQSNNGLFDGDYSAYDVGLTWQPSALGFTLGYGHAEDDNVGLTSDQATFGVTYEFNKFTLGTGVQYVDREVSGLENGIPTTLDQKAASVFVQGGFKF